MPGFSRPPVRLKADATGTKSPATIRDRARRTLYTAPSGAIVLATGSMQGNRGLDAYNAPVWHPLRVSEAAPQITRNGLARMIAVAPRQPGASDRAPSAVVTIAIVLASLAVVRAWLRRPSKS